MAGGPGSRYRHPMKARTLFEAVVVAGLLLGAPSACGGGAIEGKSAPGAGAGGGPAQPQGDGGEPDGGDLEAGAGGGEPSGGGGVPGW